MQPGIYARQFANSEDNGQSILVLFQLVEAGKLKAFRIGNRKGLQITVRSIEGYMVGQAVNGENG